MREPSMAVDVFPFALLLVTVGAILSVLIFLPAIFSLGLQGYFLLAIFTIGIGHLLKHFILGGD